MQSEPGYLEARRIWSAGFLLILALHLAWSWFNRMPPAWDMAYHQQMGWDYFEAVRHGRVLESFAHLSDYYPPLYYLIEAVVYGLFGATRWIAYLANLPGLFLASYFTFRIAWDASRWSGSALAGHLVLALPLMAWTSRESLLDPSLTGLVALSLFVVLRSRAFENRIWSWVFGVVAAGGLLLKWTYLLFIVPATVWTFFQSSDRRRSMRNRLEAALIAVPLISWWYWPNLVSLFQRFQLTTAAAAWEQDPAVWSWLGWVYYPRCLASYYLFLPLSLVFLWTLWRGRHRDDCRSRGVIHLMVVSLVGGLVLLSLLKAKDPRYVMPLTVPLCVLLVTGLEGRRKLAYAVGAWAFLQLLLVSFSFPLVPEKIALFSIPGDTDYASMRQEWVWFETDYFGVTGPPRRQDWHYHDVLEQLGRGARVGFVPDAAFFHPGALSLLAEQAGKPLDVFRLGLTDDWPARLERAEWVVGKTGNQGISYITRFNREVYDGLETLKWPLVASWDLPDGSRGRLWRNPSQSR